MDSPPTPRPWQGRRPPVPPGTALRNVLRTLGATQEEAAVAMRVSRLTVNELVGGRRDVTPQMALRLSYWSGTSPEFWLNLQREWDLWHARRDLEDQGVGIRRHPKVPEFSDIRTMEEIEFSPGC
jgi:addiction module HigA family antidote